MFRALDAFCRGDTGAITVDWVVLTGTAAAFGIITLLALTSGTTDIATDVETTLTSVPVEGVVRSN